MEAFEALGVVLDAVPEEPVLVRVRTIDDSWSDWTELEVEIDHGPDQGSEEALSEVPDRAQPSPSRTGWVMPTATRSVSARGRIRGVSSVALVREERRRVIAEAVPLAEAVDAPFPIGSRSSWGARGAHGGSRAPRRRSSSRSCTTP